MSQNPRISVIIPVYNVEKYLERCIKSVQNQSYKNLEIIIIDDGSTDRSSIICDEFAQNDKRIHVFHQCNRGVSSARNLGLEKSTGSYIAFLDADDYLVSDCEIYSKALDILLNNNADIVTWLWQYEDVEGNFTVKRENIKTEFKGLITGTEFAKLWYKGSYENGLVTCVWNKL